MDKRKMTKKYSKGFTIIEVLIVLAIAGLIMLIVFLAVPALNRNSRNLRRKTDASMIAAQREQFNIENDVTLLVQYYNCDPDALNVLCSYFAKSLSFYDVQDVTIASSGYTVPTEVPIWTNPDKILSYTGFKCNASLTGAEIGAPLRNRVVLYAIETASGPETRCIETRAVTANNIVPAP